MLLKWRYVRYTDDGCAIYQCLACKGQWESRSAPGYTMYGTEEYHAHWKFCPICGVEWAGPQRESDDQFGPRRTRVREAVEAYRDKQWRAIPPHLGWVDRFNLELKNQPRFWWYIEQRSETVPRYGSFEARWSPVTKLKGLVVPVSEVVQARDHYREVLERENPSYEDGEQRWKHETRIVAVKREDLIARYGTLNTSEWYSRR